MALYSKFSGEHMKWFMTIIEGMVTKPKSANFARVWGEDDLEIVIDVAPEDEHVFSLEVCNALKALLTSVTGVPSPVVYLIGVPHPEATDSTRATTQR